MTIEATRTVHAQQALQISELLTLKFADRTLGKGRKLEVSAPDGPSTDGGRKARQSILLSAPENQGAVVGWLDVAQKACELKAFDVIAHQYQQRFHQEIDVGREEYDTLFTEMQAFLKNQGFDVKLSTAVPQVSRSPSQRPTAAPAASEDEPNILMWTGIGFVLGFLVCLALTKLGVF